MDVWYDLLLRELCELSDPASELLDDVEPEEAVVADAEHRRIERLTAAWPEPE